METKDYLRILRNEIHSTVMATVDESGHPVTRVIDIMLADDETFYFITAKGKEFYSQLTDQKYISLTGMSGGEGMDVKEASIHKRAVSIRGKVESIGSEKLDEVFTENPYMVEIYLDPSTRNALEVFKMTEGTGEFFDLSTKPITRGSFTIGNTKQEKEHGGYFITDKCIGCHACYGVCPQKCIDTSGVPLVIQQAHCLHCGNCFRVCPVGVIVKR